MSAYRRQAQLDAPVESVWELVGNPARHPEWWPRVLEVNGERFEEGDEYVQVTRDPFGEQKTRFVVEQKDELHEIRMRCTASGTYAHWVLTEARGGTFVDVELGMDPIGFSSRVFDATAGRLFFRRWLEESLGALKAVATRRASGRAAVEPTA